ncbi:MAG: phosphatase PAP2 family protein [Planctomycetota bacterium]
MIAAAPLSLLNPRTGSIHTWQARASARTIVLLGVPIVLALHLLDAWAFHYFFQPEFRELGFFLPDWYQVLRQTGNMLTWALVAAMLWGVDARRTRAVLPRSSWRRAGWLTLATVGAGLIAELLKLILARERPLVSGGRLAEDFQQYAHHWPLIDPLMGQGNLGIPSSHTAVAFAGAIALGRLIPGTWPVLLLLALGCAWTRMLMGAHYLTDVALGAVIAWAWVVRLGPAPSGPTAASGLNR